jgi:hypothetical protein
LPTHTHGLIQKAEKDANSLKRFVRETSEGWHLSFFEDGKWIYAGMLTRKRDLEDLLVGKLTQEDR